MKSRLYWASKGVRAVFAWLAPSAAAFRLTAYFSALSVLGLISAARSLYAATREDAFNFGHELLGLSDLTDGAEVVSLNGERFHHAVSSTHESLQRVLDRLEQHCRENPGPAALVLDRLAASDPRDFERHAPPGSLRNAIFREEAGARGMVLCFVGGPGPDSPAGFFAALRRFSHTRDLSAFGRLRYTFAEQSAPERTRVVTLWADSGLNLAALFPQSGDAPGSDSRAVPRPPEARRMLSASAEGMPFAARVYQTTQSLAATQQFYDSWMSGHGYQANHDASQGATSYLGEGGSQTFLSLLESDGHTFATVTETGQTDAAIAVEWGGKP